MDHCIPPSKTGLPSLNVVMYPRVMQLKLTTLVIIDQNHELNLEDRQISAKSIAE